MALEDNLPKPSLLVGLAIGVGVGLGLALLAPGAVSQVSRTVRPTAKRVAKGALLAYARGRQGLAELREEAEDLIAEVEAEIMEEQTAAGAEMDMGNDADIGEAGTVNPEPSRKSA